MTSTLNNFYDAYQKECKHLAQTMCIKLQATARAINKGVYLATGVTADEFDMSTWKYYQNIAGDYHISDTPMEIVSLDTQEKIIFSKENLKVHRYTQNSFQFDMRHYRDLVQQYPQQELLILGILYPADKQKAIDAVDGTILSYIPNLVKKNEYTLIADLQKWLYKYLNRWYNYQYNIVDDLYLASTYAQMHLNLYMKIVTERLRRCKTPEVHEYHMRQYLASNLSMDENYDTMDDYQRQWFYRNIKYIQRNAGTNNTFEWVTQNVMTHRGLPFYEYKMKHAYIDVPINTDKVNLLLPTVQFHKRSLNQFEDVGRKIVDTASILIKEESLAKLNKENIAAYGNDINNQLQLSKSDTVNTKVLESSVTDYSEAVPHTLEFIMLNHWPYWAVSGKYKAMINITLPHNKQNFTVNAKDAFILYIYCTYKSMGFSPASIPKWISYACLIDKPIDYAKAYSIRDRKLTKKQEIDELLSFTPSFGTIESTGEFYESCNTLKTSRLMQYYYYSNAAYAHTRAELKAASLVPFEDKLLTLTTIETFEDWLQSYQLGINEYNEDEYLALAENIAYASLGMEYAKNIPIKKIQSSMIDLLIKISSYSIQVVRDSNEAKIEIIPRQRIRVAVIVARHMSNQSVRVGNIEVVDVDTKHKSHFPIKLAVIDANVNTHHDSATDVRVGLRFFSAVNVQDGTAITMPRSKIKVTTEDDYDHILKNMTVQDILNLPLD